jgi:hypothetical protein
MCRTLETNAVPACPKRRAFDCCLHRLVRLQDHVLMESLAAAVGHSYCCLHHHYSKFAVASFRARLALRATRVALRLSTTTTKWWRCHESVDHCRHHLQLQTTTTTPTPRTRNFCAWIDSSFCCSTWFLVVCVCVRSTQITVSSRLELMTANEANKSHSRTAVALSTKSPFTSSCHYPR